GVGIQTTDRKARTLDPELTHGLVTQFYRSPNSLHINLASRTQRDVSRHVHHPKTLVDQQHARLGYSAQLGDKFSVTRELLSRQRDRLFIQRCGDNRARLTRQA